jgi:Uma2 family endonuclease
MRTVASPDQIAERRRLGLDTFDEIWAGEYRVNPAPHPRHDIVLRHLVRHLDPVAEARGLVPLGGFNLGASHDHRIPDAGYVDHVPSDTYVPTARIVVEVVSPHDATAEKMPFYARHGVDEVLVVELATHDVAWHRLDPARSTFQAVPASTILGVPAEQIAASVPWERIEP